MPEPSDGTLQTRPVRSKLGLPIADALLEARVPYEYENSLSMGGQTRYPDFTIEDKIPGRTVDWKHLRMLDRSDYCVSREKKLAWYRQNGVRPVEDPGDGRPTLVKTVDSPESGVDMAEVKRLIRDVCGG